MTARTQAVVDYLRAGGSICPYARSAVLHVASASSTPRFDRREFVRAARSFTKTEGEKPAHTLLVVSSQDSTDRSFEEAEVWAKKVFLELQVCLHAIVFPYRSVEDIEREVAENVAPLFSDEKMRPSLSVSLRPLITITMSPVYAEAHPRHAPHTTLVVTWESDIQFTLLTMGAVKDAIRREMRLRHGFVYDGNELMLPLAGRR